jgi:hypothetical protein
MLHLPTYFGRSASDGRDTFHYMKAPLRLHVLAVPGLGPQLGFEVMVALRQAGLDLRVLSIGPAFLAYPPWRDHYELFQTELAERYVNIVCAPPGLFLGNPMRASEQHDRSKIQTTDRIYQPPTALSGLFTVGVPNIAITLPRPRPPDLQELAVLKTYDVVLCPDSAMTVELLELGLENADFAALDDMPAVISRYVRALT